MTEKEADAHVALASKVAAMRKYQRLHEETLIYGWKQKARLLAEEIDRMLNHLGYHEENIVH